MRHSGSFVEAADCRSVVCSNAKGGIANVVVVGHDGKLGEDASMFQVTVGHVPGEAASVVPRRVGSWGIISAK